MNNMYETALELLKKICDLGFEAYIVGGFARDKYLKKDSIDIDICTSAKYCDLKKIFDDINENSYFSYKVKYKDYNFEITTFRRDGIYINHRFPKKVKYTKKLKCDLKRRDFIINTLCIDSSGNFVDLLGAKSDLDRGLVRLVGGKNSLGHDALRILRAIRFLTILNFSLDVKLENSINKYKHLLRDISYDRKKCEIEKILKSDNVQYGCYLIQKFDLERYLDIDVSDIVAVHNINAMWAQIIIDDSYSFSKKDRKEIDLFKKLIKKDFDLYDLYKYGADILSYVVKIKKEDIDVHKLYKDIVIKDRQEIDINFFEICEIIDVDCETISEIYDDVEKEIVYGNLKNRKDDIKKFIKKNYLKS